MAFYDASAEQRTLSPLQQALLLPPDAILHHQDLLTSIAKTANFSDEKAEYILDILLKNIRESLTYNNPQTSTTSLIILDYTVRNGNIFPQYAFGRYILQKLYTICCRDLTKVTTNHKQHQDFQYRLIGTILKWHQMFTNVNGSTLNYTFSRLQKSGILALYQSYKQTQQLFNNNNISPANSQQDLMPNLPPSPQINQIDQKESDQKLDALEVRGRAMTTNPQSKQAANIPTESRQRAQSAQESVNNNKVAKQENGSHVEPLIHGDGSVKLEYTEKFQTEVNELIARYLKPSREILSSQKINLADKKLQKYLEILQLIQQRLVKIISEVKNEETIVSLAIKANDCIVSTILWFNALVKKSKQSKNKNQAVTHDKASSVSKQVIENIDLVGLEQQLLLDNANLFKRKQLRDLREQKEKQEKEIKEQQMQKDDDEKKLKQSSEPVVIQNDNNNDDMNISQQVQQAVDLISGDLISGDLISGDDKQPQQKVEANVATSVPVTVPVSVATIPQQPIVENAEPVNVDTAPVSVNVSANVSQSDASEIQAQNENTSFSSIVLGNNENNNNNNNNNGNVDVVDLLGINENANLNKDNNEMKQEMKQEMIVTTNNVNVSEDIPKVIGTEVIQQPTDDNVIVAENLDNNVEHNAEASDRL